MNHITTLLFAVGFILLLPVIIPISVFLHVRYKRRIRKLVQITACQSCGKILGLEAMRLADAEWTAYVRELHEKNPGTRFRLVRLLHAICPNCGTRYTYFEKENRFRIKAERS